MNAVLAWLGRKRVIGRRRFDWVAQSNDLGADRKPKNVALRAQLEPIRRRIAPSISIGSVETLIVELTGPQRTLRASQQKGHLPTIRPRLKPAFRQTRVNIPTSPEVGIFTV